MKAYHWKGIIADRQRLARLAKGEPAPGAPDVNVTLPPTNKPPKAAPAPAATREYATVGERMALGASTPGRAICVECASYSQRYCTNPRARDPVTGVTVEAFVARKNRDSCGLTGRYWMLRPAMPARVRVYDDSEPEQYVPPVPVRRLEPFRDEVIAVLYERASPPC